jgi:hypothetical protein
MNGRRLATLSRLAGSHALPAHVGRQTRRENSAVERTATRASRGMAIPTRILIDVDG